MKHKVKILDLRPTQCAVGMLGVDEKIAVAKKESTKFASSLRRICQKQR